MKRVIRVDGGAQEAAKKSREPCSDVSGHAFIRGTLFTDHPLGWQCVMCGLMYLPADAPEMRR